jgi:hypothetical protein
MNIMRGTAKLLSPLIKTKAEKAAIRGSVAWSKGQRVEFGKKRPSQEAVPVWHSDYAAESGICRSYMAKDIPPGQAFMVNPVMSSGHSMLVTPFADKCEDQMDRLDPLLDDPAFIDKLYNDQPILRDGQPVARPSNPTLAWHFDDLKFGILDRRTKVFFCIYPFFAR